MGCSLVALGTAGTQFSFGVFLQPMTEEFGWSRSTLSLAFGHNLRRTVGPDAAPGRLPGRPLQSQAGGAVRRCPAGRHAVHRTLGAYPGPALRRLRGDEHRPDHGRGPHSDQGNQRLVLRPPGPDAERLQQRRLLRRTDPGAHGVGVPDPVRLAGRLLLPGRAVSCW